MLAKQTYARKIEILKKERKGGDKKKIQEQLVRRCFVKYV